MARKKITSYTKTHILRPFYFQNFRQTFSHFLCFWHTLIDTKQKLSRSWFHIGLACLCRSLSRNCDETRTTPFTTTIGPGSSYLESSRSRCSFTSITRYIYNQPKTFIRQAEWWPLAFFQANSYLYNLLHSYYGHIWKDFCLSSYKQEDLMKTIRFLA